MSLSFGTAGMRAPIGPAEHQMNVRQVTRISAAVAAWLAEQAASHPHPHAQNFPEEQGIGMAFREEDPALRVVVGYDGRYGSHAFATTAAEVFAGFGFEVLLFPTATPTQLVPWLVRKWGLDGGVQITASHNPSAENGYKLYTASGRQLRDGAEAIEQMISTIEPESVPRVTVRPCNDMVRRYIDDVVEVVHPGQADLLRANSDRANIRIAMTAMHGVGGRTLASALQAAGFAQVFPVMSQHYPDPTFPSVDFPNPEEPAAVRQLLERGEEVQADVLIALDPDADRCAVGVRDRGELRMLRGDETGPLLATRLLQGCEHTPVVASTVVSSRLLPTIAADRGWRYLETPTGFKNICAAAGDTTLDYAYEEAVGIAPAPWLVDDKDGIATALAVCSWAAELKGQGLTLIDELRSLHRQYGFFIGEQVAVRTTDPAALVALWKENPPTSIAGIAMEHKDHGLIGTCDEGQLRVMVRASGTEPKVKAYVEFQGGGSEALLAQAIADVERQLLHM
ncbi:phospho-sugar mutase [Corynebacterium pseudopelargi]|uniref:Putative phosphomannomutase n=1 Tax=Corynebacterium pseudopelargi TaxID=2080757 RepID=A0A3G6IW27_9CORY|nr:phospho-sugar mutase [Corynebacterium pseudopelargi]AZA09866.1 putative phosphomannomutase [Corynebacterium pseudopelargi]